MHSFLEKKNQRRDNITTTNEVPLEAPIKNGIQIFKLEHIKYNDDRRLPFMVLKDVNKVMKDSLEAINFELLGQAMHTTDIQNIFKKMISHNESSFNNLVVYVFWIIIGRWFAEVNFTDKFMDELRL